MFSVLRKHSCGEPEVCTLPSPQLHHITDDNQVKYELQVMRALREGLVLSLYELLVRKHHLKYICFVWTNFDW